MKKLLLLLFISSMNSCEIKPKPCNPECWKITELNISKETGFFRDYPQKLL